MKPNKYPKEDINPMFLWFMSAVICTTVGSTLGIAISEPYVLDEARHEVIHLTEDCWPNKPVWTSQEPACWVNGQKVLLDND